MVTQWGMSDAIGPLQFKTGSDEVFLGREIASGRDFSDELSARIDKEVTDLVKRAEENADKILKENIKSLHDIANVLLDHETITGEEMKEIIKTGTLKNNTEKSSPDESPRKRRKSNHSEKNSK